MGTGCEHRLLVRSYCLFSEHERVLSGAQTSLGVVPDSQLYVQLLDRILHLVLPNLVYYHLP